MENNCFDIKKAVESAKNGDVEIFGRIYEFYRDKGISIARQYVKNAEDAEDMYQDAFMKAMEHIDSFDISKDFGPWLNVIIVNTCKNYLVKKKPTSFSDISDEETEFVDTLENNDNELIPESAYDRKELMGIMDDIINTLPAAQKEAVILYYYKEMSIKQIAEYQEVPEDTIKSRLNYSRKKVAAAVEEFEKKNGVKIHSIIIAPILMTLFFKNTAKAAYAESVLFQKKVASHPKTSSLTEKVTTKGSSDSKQRSPVNSSFATNKAHRISQIGIIKAIGALVAAIIVVIITRPIVGNDIFKEFIEPEETHQTDEGLLESGDTDTDNQYEVSEDSEAATNSKTDEYDLLDQDLSGGGAFATKAAETDIDGDGKLDKIRVWYEEIETAEDIFQPEYMIEINGNTFDITTLYSSAYIGRMADGADIVSSPLTSRYKYSPEYKDVLKSNAEDSYCHIVDYFGEDLDRIPDITMLIMDVDLQDGHEDIVIPIPCEENYAGDPSEGFDYTAEDAVYVLSYSGGNLRVTQKAFATGDTFISAVANDTNRINEIFVRDGNKIVVKQNEVYGSDGSHDIPYKDFFDSDVIGKFTYYDGTIKTEIVKVN